MKTIADAWWIFACTTQAAKWVKGGAQAGDYDIWPLIIIGLIPSLILWWKAGVFKRSEK